MHPELLTRWQALKSDRPPIMRGDLILSHFERRLGLLDEIKQSGLQQIAGESGTVDQEINEVNEILKVIRGRKE